MLSFELGLLWPKFMAHAGAIIGMPFSWEGTAFFLEAIFIGIFLYGWDRIHPWVHWSSGLIVGIAGVLSAVFVICANAWMNYPTGFDWKDGQAFNIDPWAAMFNPLALKQGVHMILAAFAATGFAVAGIHATSLRTNPSSRFHRCAVEIALTIGAIAAVIQPLSGDRLSKQVARYQPEKLAAMESLFHTTSGAPLLVGGLPSEESQSVRFGIHIPKLLSFLANGDLDSEVKGLDAFARETWPPVAVTHVAFQIMIGLGTLMAAVAAAGLIILLRAREWLFRRAALNTLVLCAPTGFLAIEAGWTVTEVGRQPWIMYGVMRTADAVTTMPHLVYPLTVVSGIYLLLSVAVFVLMRRQVRHVD